MKTSAKIFAGAVAAGGSAVLAAALTRWELHDIALFLGCLVAAVILSAVKIRVPGNSATVTGGFVLLLISSVLLGWQATVMIAALSGIAQTLILSKKTPAPIQVAFNLGSLVLSSLAACGAGSLITGTNPLAALLLSATVLFSVNLLLVATVVSLSDHSSLWQTIRKCNFSSFPFYCVGAVVAYAAVSTNSWRSLTLLASSLVMLSAVTSYREVVELWDRTRVRQS